MKTAEVKEKNPIGKGAGNNRKAGALNLAVDSFASAEQWQVGQAVA